MERLYSIAGLTVAMDCHGRTEQQAQAYICAESKDPDISLSREEIGRLLDWFHSEYPEFPDDLCEYYASGMVFYRKLLDHGGLQLHSSTVVVDGKAYAFTADCGTGKSTHTQLWLNRFGDRAYILNDDKPALRCEDGVWYAYGTPWSGKYDISQNERVPLAGIAVVERGEENEILPFKGIAAIHAILKQVNRPRSAQYRVKLMELLDKLISTVPVWKLRCNMDPQAAEVAYESMCGKTCIEGEKL